jgi:multidrug efflux pump
MALSVMVALILSPALTTTLLKRPEDEDETSLVGRASHWMRVKFDKYFGKLLDWYHPRAEHVATHKRRPVIAYAMMLALLAFLFMRLPTGFLPNEDQGFGQLSFQLPAGATIERTQQAQLAIEKYFLQQEPKNVDTVLTVAGGGGGLGPERRARLHLHGRLGRASGRPEHGGGDHAPGHARHLGLPRCGILRSGAAHRAWSGPVHRLYRRIAEHRGLSRDQFAQIRDQILADARADKRMANVRLTNLPDQPTLRITTDTAKLSTLGLTAANVNATLSTAWGGPMSTTSSTATV